MTSATGQGISERVVYASRCGARLDCNVWTGGGTDDTAALQAVLDRAPQMGHLHLVIDGAALVRGLDVHSNTTIECLNPACGLYLADGSDRYLVRNAHPSRDARLDRNITLLGGTYNGNCRNQVHHTPDNTATTILGFFGVECVTIRDITLRDQRTYAVHLTNWRRVTMQSIAIDLPARMQCENQDGIHVQGPGEFLVLRDIQGCAWDDFIAINADDGNCDLDENGTVVWNNLAGPNVSVGPVTDVLIDGVMVEDAAQCIRLLSRGSRLDRVIVRNVTGTYRSFGVWINPWQELGGNFGSLVFDTIDLRHGPANYDYTPPFLFSVGGRIDALSLRNITHLHPTDARPVVRIDANGDIGSLTVDGLQIIEVDERAADARYLQVGGRIDELTLRDVSVRRGPGTLVDGCLVEIGGPSSRPSYWGPETAVAPREYEARVGRLCLHQVCAERLNHLVTLQSGALDGLYASSIVCSELAGAVLAHRGGSLGEVHVDALHGAAPVD